MYTSICSQIPLGRLEDFKYYEYVLFIQITVLQVAYMSNIQCQLSVTEAI